MPGFRSVVEQTLHLHLQRLGRFRAPISVLAALVLFSTSSIVGSTSLSSVFTRATALRKALRQSSTSEAIPILNAVFGIFTHTLNTVCLGARIRIKVPLQWQQLFNRGHIAPRSDDTYSTPHAEARYWRVARRYGRRLYSGNNAPSAMSRDGTAASLVTYYTPRLLPLYRDDHHSRRKRAFRDANTEATYEGWISPRTFCKWHRMVFQDACHPTLAQAAIQIKYYSNRDLREIQRTARLLPDEQVFGLQSGSGRKVKGMTKYNEIWQSWLENKGADLVIVFE